MYLVTTHFLLCQETITLYMNISYGEIKLFYKLLTHEGDQFLHWSQPWENEYTDQF